MEQEQEKEKGTWRLDIIIMILYQITLIFSAQLIFVIFLDYMPPTFCTEANFCYKLKSMCLTDYDPNAKNLCPVSLGAERRNCIVDHKQLFFYSAQFQYQHDCTALKMFDLSTATFIGTLLGNIVLGILADMYGRRLIYFFSVLFGIPCLIISASIENIYVFYVFRVLVGFTVAGTLTVGWTYATEMINPNKRLRLLALANWPNARMIQVGLAYISKEWTRTTFLSASITCIALPILWYLPESPIWLEQKDKYEEASRARKRILKISGAIDNCHDPIQMTSFEKVTPIRILKTDKLRTSFIVIVFMYFYVGMAVYITDLNGADMTRNLYWGQFLSGLVLSVGQFIIGMSEPYLTGMGRRVLFLVSQLIAIVCYILIIFCLYSNSKGTLMYICAYTIAYASQSICLESSYLALVELMPTDVRATVGSIANIAMKIGTVLASLTKPLKFAYEPALFLINLSLGVIGVVVVFLFLEESRSADLRLVGQTTTGTFFVVDDEMANEPEPEPVVPNTPTTPITPTTPTTSTTPTTPTVTPTKTKDVEPAAPKELASKEKEVLRSGSKEPLVPLEVQKTQENTNTLEAIGTQTATMEKTQTGTKSIQSTNTASIKTMKTFEAIGAPKKSDARSKSSKNQTIQNTFSVYDNED